VGAPRQTGKKKAIAFASRRSLQQQQHWHYRYERAIADAAKEHKHKKRHRLTKKCMELAASEQQ
jgi:hypothetical protein